MRTTLFFLLLLVSHLSRAEDVDFTPPTNFFGRTLQGDDITLESLKGRTTVLTFWATWCKYCVKELNWLHAVQTKIDKSLLDVVAVNFKEDRKIVRQISRQLGSESVTLTVDERGAVSKYFGVEALPQLYIIDRDGVVKRRFQGYSEETFKNIVQSIIDVMGDDAKKPANGK